MSINGQQHIAYITVNIDKVKDLVLIFLKVSSTH